MSMDQTVSDILTPALIMICQESESQSLKKVKVNNALQETGLKSTGKVCSRMVESSPILIPKEWDIQKNSQLVLPKFSNAGILYYHN